VRTSTQRVDNGGELQKRKEVLVDFKSKMKKHLKAFYSQEQLDLLELAKCVMKSSEETNLANSPNFYESHIGFLEGLVGEG
jgi:hypothetical protein